ncbi:MAG: SBBP repeat-containing protein, partial [Chthoniobacterales bacterium]
MSFEPKKDQTASSAEFLARGPGYLLSLAPTKAVFALVDHATVQSPGAKHPSTKSAPITLAINLLGSNPGAMGSGAGELKGKAHYFKGNNPALWRTNVPTFGQVRYEGVYPGIDLVYYGNQKRLEYDFVVAPGSDPGTIALAISGAERVEVEPATGDLLLRAGTHTMRQHKPIAYQNTSNGRREIESRYLLGEDGRVGFAIGEYDTTAALVIDPVLAYSTYLGGQSIDRPYGIAVDANGSAYVAGYTSSTDFPLADPLQGAAGGGLDALVTKFSVNGMSLVYSTYLGGNGSDLGFAIAVDADGNAYVTGQTDSIDFPIANPYQGLGGGMFDGFIAKLSADGSALVYSTYLGGADQDQASAIAVNSAGNAFVTGGTSSTDFPTVTPLQNTLNGDGDAFVTKLSADGTALTYSTFLGGSDSEGAIAIAIDSAGNAYITGNTASLDFPTVHAFQSTNAGLSDVFVSKLNAAGSALVYSTYLGGSDTDPTSANDGADYSNAIAVDSSGNAYVTGYTASVDFPLVNPIQDALSGINDAFVTKFNTTGTDLVYSTYLGGTNPEFGQGIAVDAAGNAYVVGQTKSADFPIFNAFQSTYGSIGLGGDAFVTKINPTGGAFVYSSYLGGSSADFGYGVAVDSAGTAYIAGTTDGNFPTVNPFQVTYGGGGDAFVARITDASSSPQTLLNISTRLQVLTDDKVLIGGFIVTGTDPKMVILRAIGPALIDFGIPDALANPVLELHAADGSLIMSNDDWKMDQQSEIEMTGLAPTKDLESAILATLDPGAYTAIVSGKDG